MGRDIGRHLGGDGHRAQLEARAQIERHRDLQGRLRRRSVDDRGQRRIVQLVAGDRRGDGRLVVAEAVQRGLEPAGILARPFGQREARHGCRFLQRDQSRTALQGGVERAVAGWFQVTVYGCGSAARNCLVRARAASMTTSETQATARRQASVSGGGACRRPYSQYVARAGFR